MLRISIQSTIFLRFLGFFCSKDFKIFRTPEVTPTSFICDSVIQRISRPAQASWTPSIIERESACDRSTDSIHIVCRTWLNMCSIGPSPTGHCFKDIADAQQSRNFLSVLATSRSKDSSAFRRTHAETIGTLSDEFFSLSFWLYGFTRPHTDGRELPLSSQKPLLWSPMEQPSWLHRVWA